MMLIFKILFLVANAYFSSKALTPPGPLPPTEELVKDSEKKMALLAPYILMAERVRCCLIITSSTKSSPT